MYALAKTLPGILGARLDRFPGDLFADLEVIADAEVTERNRRSKAEGKAGKGRKGRRVAGR